MTSRFVRWPVRTALVEVLCAEHQGFDKLSPNGGKGDAIGPCRSMSPFALSLSKCCVQGTKASTSPNGGKGDAIGLYRGMPPFALSLSKCRAQSTKASTSSARTGARVMLSASTAACPRSH